MRISVIQIEGNVECCKKKKKKKPSILKCSVTQNVANSLSRHTHTHTHTHAHAHTSKTLSVL